MMPAPSVLSDVLSDAGSEAGLFAGQLRSTSSNRVEDEPKELGARDALVRLIKLVRPEAHLICLGTLGAMCASAAVLCIPNLAGKIIDGMSVSAGSEEAGRTDWYLLLILCVGAALALASWLETFCFIFASSRFAARLRKQVFANVLRQEVAFFDAARTGELLSRLASDTNDVRVAATNSVASILRHGAQVMHALGSGESAAVAATAAVADEALSSISFARRQDGRRYASPALSYAGPSNAPRGYDAAVSFAAAAAAAALLWYGTALVRGGTMTPGQLSAYFLYGVFTAVSLALAARALTELLRGVGSAARVLLVHYVSGSFWSGSPGSPLRAPAREGARPAPSPSPSRPVAPIRRRGYTTTAPLFLSATARAYLGAPSAPPPTFEPPGAQVPPRPEGRVLFDRLSFRYPARPDVEVLSDVTLELEPSRVTALVGPSGGGKSTLVAMLLRQVRPEGVHEARCWGKLPIALPTSLSQSSDAGP
eukprot:tig00000654_g2824.t1